MKTTSTRFKYILMVFFCVMIWGSAYPAVRWLSLSGVNAYLIVCMRVLFSFLFSCLLLIFTRTKLRPRELKSNFWPFALLGICGSAGFLTLMTLGLQFTEAGKGSFLVGVNPIYIVLLSAVFLGEALTARKLIGVVIAIVGVCFTLIGGDIVEGVPITFSFSDMILILAGFLWAVYTLLSRKFGHRLDYYQGLFLMFGISSILVLPMFIKLWPQFLALNGKQLFWALWCGFMPGGFGYFLWNKGINVLGASTCGMINSFLAVFSTIYSVIFLHESMVWLQIIGGILVVFGVLQGLNHSSMPINYETGRSVDEE